MVKAPRPGRVKTRLGREIGHVAAAWWFRHQVRRLLWRVDDPRWRSVLSVSPDRDGMLSRVWPRHLPRMPQGKGDLGARMARALRSCDGPVCLIGADIPAVDRTALARSFALLGRHDAVFGPAVAGGFWLIGVRHPRRLPYGFFRDVRWSTEHALSDAKATLPGWRIARGDLLKDVDSAADLRA